MTLSIIVLLLDTVDVIWEVTHNLNNVLCVYVPVWLYHSAAGYFLNELIVSHREELS